MAAAAPHLHVRGSTRPVGLVLLLPGGQPDSHAQMREWDVALLRMRPFAWQVTASARRGVAVARLRYAVRGWNGEEKSPAVDALWALDRLSRRFPEVPIALIGHSMGGRVALDVGGHPAVHGVVALAPWLPGIEPVEQLVGRTVLIAHGTRDRVTSLDASREYAARAAAAGVAMSFREMDGLGHTMVLHAQRWHRLAAGFALSTLRP